MTRATVTVEFPDGTRKYGIYSHTVGRYWPALRDTPDEAWRLVETYYKPGDWDGFNRVVFCAPEGEPQPVRVSDPYDDDWPDGDAWLDGLATPNALIRVDADAD